MNSLRVARAALRVRPTATITQLARRGYADAVSDKVGLMAELWVVGHTLLTLCTDQVELVFASSGMFRILAIGC